MVLDLMAQLDRECTERNKIESLLRELLNARRNRKSEQLSSDQLALFAAAWQARQAEAEPTKPDGSDDDDPNANSGADESASKKRTGGRQPLARHLKRERIVHDLAEEEKHCSTCQQDLRPIGEESSERYEYIPAKLTVIEDICADHLPLHRQEKIFERHGVDISRKTMGGWLAQCADLLKPLYGSMKEVLFQSKVIGTDDTSVKVLDVKLPFARTGRIWPYSGDADHPVILYDYTATRERAGPEEFLKGYRGYLQADAYGGYDAFFRDPARGLIEVGCWAHARRYFHKALESDQPRMGPALLLIAQLYRVEKQARPLTAEDRLRLRQLQSQPILEKLRNYLLEIQVEVLPKSPEGRAVRYTLKNWTALNRYCEDGDLQIDNNATERAIRGIAVGRNNWVFFGSDEGGKTAAVLRSFVASCQRVGVDPFVWLKDILSRIADHPITRIAELLPHNWASAQA